MKFPEAPSNFTTVDPPQTRSDLRRIREAWLLLLAYLKDTVAALEAALAALGTTYLKRAAGDFSTFTTKATPVSADVLLIEDSAASGAKKFTTVGAIGGGISLRNPYVDPPAAPHLDNDEFTVDTLASGGWIVRDMTTPAVLTRAGDVDPWTDCPAGQYRSTVKGSMLLFQGAPGKLIYIYKPIAYDPTATLLWARFATFVGFPGAAVSNAPSLGLLSVGTAASLPSAANDYQQVQYIQNPNRLQHVARALGATNTVSYQLLNDPTGVSNIGTASQIAALRHYVVGITPTSRAFMSTDHGAQFDLATNPASVYTNYAYVAFSYFFATGAGSTFCGLVSIDYFRRADGATAWITG